MKVLCTREFISDLEKFSRSRSTITEKLLAFIGFRETHPDRLAFNPDDTYYAKGTPLSGFRHVHLHHGKCIVVYKTTAETIFLLAVVDHDAEDSPKVLANYLNRIKDSDLVPFARGVNAPAIDPNLISVIRNEVFEMIASDPDIVRKSLRGDPTLIDYLAGHAPADEIMAAFGGADGFSSFLRKALADYGIREGLRDWINIVNEAADPLTFREDVCGSYGGQTDVTLRALRGGISVGTIDYSVYRGEPQIHMIKVDPVYRRQGVASALLRELQSHYPDAEIDWGMLSDEGNKLYKATPFQVVSDPEVADALARLKAVKAKLADYKRRSEEFEKGARSEMARTIFLSSVSDWNDLHDECSAIKAELAGRKAEKKIIQNAH